MTDSPSPRSGLPEESADREWRQIELEAMEAARATLHTEETTPLAPGSLIAWTEARFGRTDGFSSVHRVTEATGDVQTTLCGEIVPAPIRRISHLSAGLVRTLGRCRYCENGYAQRGQAA